MTRTLHLDEASTLKAISEIKSKYHADVSNEDLAAWRNVFLGQSATVPRLKVIAVNVAMAFPVHQAVHVMVDNDEADKAKS